MEPHIHITPISGPVPVGKDKSDPRDDDFDPPTPPTGIPSNYIIAPVERGEALAAETTRANTP